MKQLDFSPYIEVCIYFCSKSRIGGRLKCGSGDKAPDLPGLVLGSGA